MYLCTMYEYVENIKMDINLQIELNLILSSSMLKKKFSLGFDWKSPTYMGFSVADAVIIRRDSRGKWVGTH